MSGLFDSKSIVKKVVCREKANKGETYYYSEVGITYIYTYIYI